MSVRKLRQKGRGGRLSAGKLPAYRLHKPSGRAIVCIKGKVIYLGSYGSPESREHYARLIADYARGQTPQSGSPAVVIDTDPDALTVAELCLKYLPHAQQHYSKDGQLTGEYDLVCRALKELRTFYGTTLAKQFGPIALKAVRQSLVDRGLSRAWCNSTTNRIRRMFRWGVAEQLIEPSVYQALLALPGLQKGRSTAREPEPIGPVANETVDATLPFLRPVVAAMVQFQRLTGARPGEVCSMQPHEVDRNSPVWLYRPSRHKSQHKGRERIIAIGPRAQAVLKPYLDRCNSPDAIVFPTGRRKPAYDRHSYAMAIRRACCKVAGSVRPTKPQKPTELAKYHEALELHNAKLRRVLWHPNQLRHSAGTAIRSAMGLEAAQVALGHARADVTQIYAERDLAKAIEVAAQMG